MENNMELGTIKILSMNLGQERENGLMASVKDGLKMNNKFWLYYIIKKMAARKKEITIGNRVIVNTQFNKD